MTFSFFAVLIPLVASILTKLMHSSSNLMLADASFIAIDNILNEKPLPERQKLNVPENTEISLNDVSFWYEEGVKAIDHISMTIKPGTVTALVGESGGGKSTVANLIARFWDVSDGSVTVGGVDVRDLDYSDLMKHISVVFQDTNLFKMSVAENVAMYKPDAFAEGNTRSIATGKVRRYSGKTSERYGFCDWSQGRISFRRRDAEDCACTGNPQGCAYRAAG